jgi:cyclopropane-fatty-acyl-phospholipid synthase
MWEFYLISAEMMFRHGAQEVFQMLLSRKRDAIPIRRDFMIDVQRGYKAREPDAMVF